MSLFSDIQSIFSSVQSGNELTPAEYETLAESSENETIRAVGEENAVKVEAAYDAYVKDLLSNNGKG